MGATFDPTGKYRYRLWREWDADAPPIAFVMLNPSTADAESNDPTIRRCVCLARSWGYGAIEVVNLFAYRAVDPKALRQVTDPVGEENDRHLVAAMRRSQVLILAWGNWGTLHQRDRAVWQLLSPCRAYCLGINRSGQPRHPLYVRCDVTPIPLASPGTSASPCKLSTHSRSKVFT